MCTEWGNNAAYEVGNGIHPHEAHYLKLDCSKAKKRLQWQPNWDLEQTLGKIVEWVHAYQRKDNMRETCIKQILEYMKS